MSRRGALVLVVILVGLAAGGYWAYRDGVSARAVLWLAKREWEATRDLRMQVEGDIEVMGFPTSVSGRLSFKRPGLYDLDLGTPRIIAGPNALWIVVPPLNAAARVYSERLSSRELLAEVVTAWRDRDPMRWVDRAEESARDVDLLDPEELDGTRCWVLAWPSRSGERVGGKLYVSQASRLPIGFDELDADETVKHECRIRELRRNTGLTDDDFTFKPSGDYMVIGCDYDRDRLQSIEDLLGGGRGDRDTAEDTLRKLEGKARDWLKKHGIE